MTMTYLVSFWLAAAAVAGVSQAPETGRPYVLGSDDLITIRALHVPEMPEKPVRVEADGFVRLPLVGRLRAGGLTAAQLEEELSRRLRTYIETPEVSVEVTEQRSQPFSVIGAVKNPGVHQLGGPKSLLEALSLAGGLESDAGYSIRIARRASEGPLPLPNACRDESGDFIAAETGLEEVMRGGAAGNLEIKPHDVITVARAKMVYVIGEVRKPGGFTLQERENVSVLQVLSMAEGLTRTAGPARAKVLRPNGPGGQRQEIPVNLNDVLSGKLRDLPLMPEDILFVPNSASKSAALRTVEAAIQMGTGIVIWRR